LHTTFLKFQTQTTLAFTGLLRSRGPDYSFHDTDGPRCLKAVHVAIGLHRSPDRPIDCNPPHSIGRRPGVLKVAPKRFLRVDKPQNLRSTKCPVAYTTAQCALGRLKTEA
jgi:hypothetical protein